MNKFLLLLFVLGVVSASEITMIQKVPLATDRFTLQAGEKREFQSAILKNSAHPSVRHRVALRIRAIAVSQQYSGGWTMLMQLRINDRIVDRFNEHRQARLLNRPDTKQLTGGPNIRYSGSAWYDRNTSSWDVGYGVDFLPGEQFNPYFKEDITDYLFDIDDLITLDAPVTVSVANIADKIDALRNLMMLKAYSFPMAIASVELIVFENPEGRVAASKPIAPPKPEASTAMRNRIRKFSVFSADGCAAELSELRRAAKLFPKFERHTLLGNTISGHLWIQYDSRQRNAASFIPLLDRAKEAGVGLVKVHSYWADINATGPFRPRNAGDEQDYRKLIGLCHERGLKFIAYVSPAWVKLNQDYSTDWEFSDPALKPAGPGKWGQVCTGSPEWRSFFFGGVRKLFEDYPVDGIYVDIGINNAEESRCRNSCHSHPFRDDPDRYASSSDMMNRLYALCRRNGKLLYLFAESVPDMETFCDVQYVGESTPSMAAHRERHGNFNGNIFFLVMSHTFTYYSLREIYASTMVLGHFPLFSFYEHMSQQEEFAWFCHFLPLWSAMTSPGTHVYRKIELNPLVKTLPAQGMLTAFVNTDIYLVAANFGDQPEKFEFSSKLEDMESGEQAEAFTVSERDLKVFRLPPEKDRRRVPD